ncbi:DUF1801 domain-containing protein [Spirosoma endbachense]|uniref:DUF1801 domain-containing protein n=1 Tax=Spirosoma endbachense TaxID=2666025 RepID=A0A6P1VVY5_9BACT|nr:DUF1801 domain-containing protein [Spirosoma endbachense]QHV96915.1 DUF1801 domain-containing protein [Spirosoma endbachense]
MKEIDNFYLQKEESIKSCLLAIRDIICSQDIDLTSAWKYGMPFFCYKGKMVCYLWVHKKRQLPYLGLVEGKRLDHPDLLLEKRSRMKIMLFNPNEDLPRQAIETILGQTIDLYKSGEIPLRK